MAEKNGQLEEELPSEVGVCNLYAEISASQLSKRRKAHFKVEQVRASQELGEEVFCHSATLLRVWLAFSLQGD